MLIPRNTNVLIELDEKETSIGGIIIPDSVSSPVTTGTVVAVPNSVSDLHPGDRVHFNAYSTRYLSLPEKLYAVVDEKDIFVRDV